MEHKKQKQQETPTKGAEQYTSIQLLHTTATQRSLHTHSMRIHS